MRIREHRRHSVVVFLTRQGSPRHYARDEEAGNDHLG
jgi:hypothetical protein